MHSWLIKAALLYHEVADYMASLNALKLIGTLGDVLLSTKSWPEFGKAVQKMAREAHVSGCRCHGGRDHT